MKTSILLSLVALLGTAVAVLAQRRRRSADEAALWAEATDPLPGT